MKWYTAISSYSGEGAHDSLRVALHSCIKNTKFKPNIICDKSFNFIDQLKQKYKDKITIHYCDSEIANKFLSLNDHNPEVNYASGAYLRAEISQIEQTSKLILYTDIDVIFQSFSEQYLSIAEPEYFSAAPEFNQNDYSYCNTGSMFINVPNLRSTYSNFKQYIINNLKDLPRVAHDQGAFNYFYKNKWTKLNPEFNWKPQWGWNEAAPIIHFHAAKTFRIKHYFSEHQKTLDPMIRQIISINDQSCKKYLELYEALLTESNNQHE